MQYQLEPSEYVLSRMQVAAANLGGSAIVINPLRDDGSPGVSYLAVNVPDGTAWDVLQNAYANARKPRLPRAIMADLLAQVNSAALRNAIIADLNSGSPPKWQLARSDAVWSTAVVWRNTTGAVQTEALLVGVAFYITENPTYLVNPPFAPALNVPGDEPA